MQSSNIAWRTTRGNFVVQTDVAPIPLVTDGVGLTGGAKYEYSATFYEINAAGAVTAKYGRAEALTLDSEDVVSSIHLVIDGSLYHFYWSRPTGGDPSLQFDRRLKNLQPYTGELPFDFAAVVAAYEQAVARLIAESTGKPSPSAILYDVTGHGFRLFELTAIHRHTELRTVFDRYMDQDMTYEYRVTDYYRVYLAIPAAWYRDDAFVDSAESAMQAAIRNQWLTDDRRAAGETLSFMPPVPSSPEALNRAKESESRCYHFNEDGSIEEASLSQYRETVSQCTAAPPAPVT